MAVMDPCSFELLSGPPLPGGTPAHHAAALHSSLELPATLVEVPVTYAHLSAYDAEIDVNLREMERNAKLWPNPDYMKTVQGGRMSKHARADLVSWMDDFTRFFNLAPGTLHRAVSYVDRVLSERALSTTTARMEYQLRLLGATAVYTAAKYEEQSTTLTVNATGVAEICGLHTTKEEVIGMELKMCAVLQYDLSGPTAHTFVEHFTRHSEGEQELEVQRVAHDLARRSLADYRLMQLLPSEVAASAVFLARLILNPKAIQVEQWNKDFEELTGYKPTDLLLGIEPLYMMMNGDDPRFEVAPAFLDGKFWY